MTSSTLIESPVRTVPMRYRWTVARYLEAARFGLFENQRVELIAGDIIVMSPINPPHAVSTMLVQEALRAVFGSGFAVRVQMPLLLGGQNAPEPDVAIVPGTIRQYAKQHPTTAVLVVEVADTSLTFDMGEKATMYAAAGISDYWVVDLPHQQVMVHRQPSVNGYGAITVHSRGESIAPLAMPSTMIAVADLLP